MSVRVQGAPGALDNGDGAGVGCLARKPHVIDQVRSDDWTHDAEHFARDRRPDGRHESRQTRKAQSPLAHELFGKDVMGQQSGVLSMRRDTVSFPVPLASSLLMSPNANVSGCLGNRLDDYQCAGAIRSLRNLLRPTNCAQTSIRFI